MIRPALAAGDLVINRQIPKWEENSTTPTQPLLQSEKRVFMRPRWRCVPHIRPLWVVVAMDNLRE